MINLSKPWTLGKRTFEISVEADTFHEAVEQLQNISLEDIDSCGICKSDNLTLDYVHVDKAPEKSFSVARIKCIDCRSALSLSLTYDHKPYIPKEVSPENPQGVTYKWYNTSEKKIVSVTTRKSY